MMPHPLSRKKKLLFHQRHLPGRGLFLKAECRVFQDISEELVDQRVV
jgi:hypothetical protein